MAPSSHRYPRRTSAYAWALALTALVAVGRVDAVVCSQSQQTELSSLVDANKQLFQTCVADLKLSVDGTTAAALTSVVHEDYLQEKNADAICASDNCVRALIQAMEKLPDCCTQVASATRNLPRLADDILHQCDVRDARQLASELEAEIAKLPDLKVQIKSLGTGKTSDSVSGSGDLPTIGDGVDVIIDVKKRELMKTGGLGLTPNDSKDNSSTVVASSNSAAGLAAASASMLLVAACSVVQLLL